MTITINGSTLTEAQNMTIHTAVQNLATDLTNDGLGDDETGKAICAGYLARIAEINRLMFEREETAP
jgi:hypothetical protein